MFIITCVAIMVFGFGIAIVGEIEQLKRDEMFFEYLENTGQEKLLGEILKIKYGYEKKRS